MAKIPQPSANLDLGPLAPAGLHVATCIKIVDQFNVERPKFENKNEMETKNVTTFYFAFQNITDGQLYKVKTFEMTISGGTRSKLFNTLKSWLGRPPEHGWDYCEMVGKGAQINVQHRSTAQGKTYANIEGIMPLAAGQESRVFGIEYYPLEEAVSAEDAAYASAQQEMAQQPAAPPPPPPPAAAPANPPDAVPQPSPAAPPPPPPAAPTAAPQPAAPPPAAAPYNTNPPTEDDVPF